MFLTSHLTAIICEPLDILNGQVTYSNRSNWNIIFRAVATFICDEGFALFGSGTRTCTGNGTSTIGEWSGEQAFCVIGKYLLGKLHSVYRVDS